MKQIPFILLVLVLTLILPPCVFGDDSDPRTGLRRVWTDHRILGSRRSYRVYVPEGISSDQEVPLIMVLHGAFDNALRIMRKSGFNRVADEHGCIVVYPEGGYRFLGFFQHWSAGHCCGKAQEDGVDDAGFIEDVMDEVISAYPIDERRVYLCGHSNGGMLVHYFAALRPDRVAACAVSAGTIGSRPSPEDPWGRIPTPIGPVPMMMIHGNDDRIVPPAGGSRTDRDGGGIEFLPLSDSIGLWVTANKPRHSADLEKITMALSEGAVQIDTYSRPDGSSPVQVMRIDGLGHAWPDIYYTGELEEDDPLFGFRGSDLIWDFFSRFP
jgi:polyhydroxybutyrate depolymerase